MDHNHTIQDKVALLSADADKITVKRCLVISRGPIINVDNQMMIRSAK